MAIHMDFSVQLEDEGSVLDHDLLFGSWCILTIMLVVL